MLCLLLLPVLGTGRFFWFALRGAAQRPRRLLVLGGLVLAVRSTNPAPFLAPNGIGLLEHMIPLCVGLVGIVVLWHGLRSSEFRLLWRRLR